MPNKIKTLQEELFQNIFEFANGGIAIVALEGRWVKVNPSLVQLLGYAEEELYDLTFQDITHPEDLNKDLKQLDLLRKGEIENYQMEKRYFHKNGDVIWALLSVSMVVDEFKKPYYFISQITEITEQKKNVLQLNLLMDLVQEQNTKLLNFSHIATHDIRTHVGNLGSIIGFVEDDYDNIEKNENFVMLKECLSNLEDTLEHLNEIRKNKLDNSKQLKPLSLYNYVNSSIANVNAIAKKYHCQILNHVKKDHKVLAIEAYLESIILNFLTNAIKYRAVNRLPIINITSEIEGDFVVIKIEDNGLGIDLVKNRSKLFTLNGTFHKHNDSRGVGLFITKNHIESIGGKVEVESEVNVGTSFSIYLKKA